MALHQIYANKPNGTLYVGSTSGLIKWAWEHKSKVNPNSFTAKYNTSNLVYYEVHERYLEAARREKRFKKWPGQWKINIIEDLNIICRNLYADICS
ncbi:MAG: GIY-YIG nuclease family protein [Gammaproteobacteria bacterium]|nr:GIY-YIG nuclease family protein [Gammaproteobacteria bacterium]MCH9764278.1 GIY-YIG nuclease family protein [Gammaproteobacteria bacterium]